MHAQSMVKQMAMHISLVPRLLHPERGNELGDKEEPGYEIMAQVLKLRTNPWQVYEAKYLPPTVVIYSHTGFHNDQVS